MRLNGFLMARLAGVRIDSRTHAFTPVEARWRGGGFVCTIRADLPGDGLLRTHAWAATCETLTSVHVPSEATQILAAMSGGDRSYTDRLMEIVSYTPVN